MGHARHAVVVRTQVGVVERCQRHAFGTPKIIECHVQPFVLLQLFEKPFEVGDYFALILFEFHSLKSFDVTRDFLEDDVFRRHVLFRQRADIGVDDILLGPFRYYMKRVHSERRQTVAFVVEIVTRGVMGVQQVFRRFSALALQMPFGLGVVDVFANLLLTDVFVKVFSSSNIGSPNS